jgi:hypothetical protein
LIGNTNLLRKEKTPSRCIEHAPRRKEDYNRLIVESIEKSKENKISKGNFRSKSPDLSPIKKKTKKQFQKLGLQVFFIFKNMTIALTPNSPH